MSTLDSTIIAIDTASKVGVGNDFSAIVTLGTDARSSIYILDVIREQLEFNDLARKITERWDQHQHRGWPQPERVVIEDASAGAAVIQGLRRSTMLPIVAVPPRGSKVSRSGTEDAAGR